VPGEVHGLWTAFKRFGSGKIAWMDLLMPTVNLLTEGQATTLINILNLKLQ
jgi:gamma-glutamyltranspeptidase